jgi:hypothetical protein
MKDIFPFNSNQDWEEGILVVLVTPGYLEWQQVPGGNCCSHMLTLHGLDISKTLLILSKFTKHVALRN